MTPDDAIEQATREARRIAQGRAAVGVDYWSMPSLEGVRESLEEAIQKLIRKVNVFAPVETEGKLRTRVAFDGSLCSVTVQSPSRVVCEDHMAKIDAQWRTRIRVLQFVNVVFVALVAIPQVYLNPAMALGAVRRLIEVVERTASAV